MEKRLRDDTGAGGLFAPGAELVTEIYENSAPSPFPVGPILVFDIESMEQNNPFNSALYAVRFRINVYVQRDIIRGTHTAAQTASQIIGRVRGDWVSAANHTPTYGLHRHALTLSDSDYTADPPAHLSSIPTHDETHLHYVETFRTYLREAA